MVRSRGDNEIISQPIEQLQSALLCKVLVVPATEALHRQHPSTHVIIVPNLVALSVLFIRHTIAELLLDETV